MLYTKYERSMPGSLRQDDFFVNFILKTYFWARDILMQPIRTIWTISVPDHPGSIPVEFGQIPISGSREEVDCSFPYITQCKIVTPGAGSVLTPGA